MQKISSYLYPNRINIVADVAVFPVRWNIVYQNRIKIYQGVDNLLTLDVKNADQKRIDIDEMDLEMCIMSTAGKLVATLPVTPSETKGLATVNVSAVDLEEVTPQFLNFTIYKINEDSTKTVFYADTQFGAKGNMELLGYAVATPTPARYISRFLTLTNDRSDPFVVTYYSDAVEITRPNFTQNVLEDSLNFEFLTHGLDAEITVEFTKDSVISSSTEWEEIEKFTIASTTVTTIKTYTYPMYTREFTWARVKYNRLDDSQGKIVKVIVTFDEIEEFFIDNEGPDAVFVSGIDGGFPDDEGTTTIDAGER
jgi:hypothetical protein